VPATACAVSARMSGAERQIGRLASV
jgi:hypothetical protein